MKQEIYLLFLLICIVISGSNAKYINRRYSEDVIKDRGIEEETEDEYYTSPKYKYSYGVEDPKTGDYKSAREERDHDVVKGEYTVADPDGTIRTVKYTVGKHTGYQAVIITSKGGQDIKQEFYGFPITYKSTQRKDTEPPFYSYY